MTINPTLYCPIRGQLKVRAKAKDGLTFTEEKRRIDCIKYLLHKGYHPSKFKIESTLFRFGHGGRNSFRTDIVVFDAAANILSSKPLEEQLDHIYLIGEVKRDSKDAILAKETQVKAALGFLPDMNSIGVYWDDIEQKIFYKKLRGTKQQLIEAPLTYLPEYGNRVSITKLRYNDLETSPNLIQLFKKVEDAIHPYVSDISTRYELILQLLLVKIFDEGANKYGNGIMTLQDFSLFDLSDSDVYERFSETLGKSLNIYQKYLPKTVSETITIPGSLLRNISQYLAPVNLLESNPEAMQSFYMYFAKQLYRWDLAQHFTPYEVVDFIVKLANPGYGETTKDPACGSADFLISTHRQVSEKDPKAGEKIFGADNSLNAVQISVLNMLLNGDGKSNIIHEDSLVNINQYRNLYDVLLCNPPFGIRIVERRKEVLEKFDLGKDMKSQQTGILFAELCVKQAKRGGRIAIILPNGYLGNRSTNYVTLRHWLLMHTKVACIIGFPRFTFKKSGADVSASVLILEKRERPLLDPQETEDYPVYINLLESVGWEIGNKIAKRIYKRNPQNGAIQLDDDNNPILDADFDEVLADLYSSPVINAFPWIAKGIENANITDGWSISIRDIVNQENYVLDPKRLCRKYNELIWGIKQDEYESLLDICEVIPQGWKGKKNAGIYRYVEIGDVHESSYEYSELRGWQLPSRARHKAEPGDVFVGSIWGSVKKWFIAGPETKENDLIVTNGFHRLRVKPDKKHRMPDLIFALSSEFYSVQMRALATGSDGLAEISEDDLGQILIPILKDKVLREEIEKYIKQFVETTGSLGNLVAATKTIPSHLLVPSRKTNFSQV